jgi:type I restriction enzyme, R subunit
MNEAETRAELIDPALKAAGWGVVEHSRVRREVIAPGRLLGSGRRARQDIADYVLTYRSHKLAVIEAKKQGEPVTLGLAQAKRYAEKLQTRYAYSTNGQGIYQADMVTGVEGDVTGYPTPDELWDAVYGQSEARQRYWRDRFAAVPYEDKGGQWQTRYYQHTAIDRTLEAIGTGQNRILLTLATGTGKTAIAFQIAWKLFHSRWNLKDWQTAPDEGREPTRRPRILFLADRNILANQAFNAFNAFPEDGMARISPSEIRKKGKVPKNASLFFTIFQTFMSGTDDHGEPQPYFGEYPPDFFDFIVIDECHRGGANDESNWRAIMDYFAPAVQLGLTATPKRKVNTDTYAYFGEPVYTYSLKDGINDGFLTPFKVKQIQTTLDEYVYTADDDVVEGEIEEGKRYKEKDFNRVIEIKEREAKRVELFMDMIDQSQKTLVFCATQVHALAVRDLINQMATNKDPNYCVRVTADDGAAGEQSLSQFQDNEKTLPTILTTSQKLSTGVDARNIRNIVLMRPIKQIIEFKQIIGRGTRLYDGKDYFTIFDFVKAYEHFNDSEWDGEPLEPVPAEPGSESDPKPPADPKEPGEQPKRVRVQLAPGKARTIDSMVATSFWDPSGKPLSGEEFLKTLFGSLPDLFADENELRKLWSKPGTRKTLLEELEKQGFSMHDLARFAELIRAQDSDIYDVLAFIGYDRSPIPRRMRAEWTRPLLIEEYSPEQQDFLDFVLNQYVAEGVGELGQSRLPDLVNLKYHSIDDAERELGDIDAIAAVFSSFQRHLYFNPDRLQQVKLG